MNENDLSTRAQKFEAIITPCVRVCVMNAVSVCEGCGRTLDEIMKWTQYSHAERVAVMERLGIAKCKAPSSKPGGN